MGEALKKQEAFENLKTLTQQQFTEHFFKEIWD